MGKQKYFTEEEKKEKQRERCRKWYYEHKEQVKERKKMERLKKLAENPDYDKEWYAKHRNYYRQYDADNKEQRKEFRKKYDKEHKEDISRNKKRYNATKFGRAVNICSTYTQADKYRNRGECTLTPQWIVDNIFSGQKCVYCQKDDWTELGCDRIDNSKPHTPDNVVPCCGECNIKRGTKKYEDFINETQNSSIHTNI